MMMRQFITLLIFSAVTFGMGLQSLAQCTTANRHYPLESPSGTEIINGIIGTYTNTIGGSNMVAEDRFEEDDKSLWLLFYNGNNLDVPWINTTQATISMWVSPITPSNLQILMRGSSLTDAVHLCIQPTTRTLGMLDATGTFIPSSFSFPTGLLGHETWRHIVFEADGPINRIYVDGVMVLENTSGYDLTVDPIARFLNDIPTNVNRGYEGGINNIKVYERLLSSDEIQFVRGFQTYPNAHYTRNPSCVGDLVELTAPMFNAPTGTTYQWFKDGVAISGATSDTYTFSSNFTNGGVYTVEAYFDCLTETNRAFVVSSAAEIAPSKNNDLTDAEFCENGFGMLEFDVSGLDNSYQWYFNGSPVTGNKPQITFNPALPFQEGEWYVEASNTCGSTTSSTAYVTINPPSSQEVTLHPINTTACSGSVITLTGEFNYADSYQWYFITPFPSQNIALTGETNNNLTFNPLQASANGTYILVASDGNGCELATNPGFVGSSGGITNRYPIENGTALDVIGNNDGNPIGQLSDANRFGTANSAFFQDNTNGKLVDIDDITSPSIAVSLWFKYGQSSPNSGYSILMSPDDTGLPIQLCISNSTFTGTLGLFNGAFYSPGTPISKSNTAWRNVVYTANNGVSRIYLDGTLYLEETVANIDPATVPISRFANGWNPNAGQGLWGTLDDINIFDGFASLSEAQLMRGFSSGPQNLVADCTGENLSFLPTAYHFNAASTTHEFQWYKDGVLVPGLTDMELNLTDVQASDAGVYVLRVNLGCFFVESEPVTVTVNGEAPQITLDPADQTICEGQTLTLTGEGSGSGILSYSWRRNGTHVMGGTNMTAYSIPNATAANSGAWTVEISNTCGSIESDVATIIVGTPATITTQPSSQNLCTGQSFTVSAGTSGDVVSYHWQKDGTPITGANAASFTIPSLVLSDAGSYVCVMEDACGNALTTTAAALTITEGINVSFQPNGGTVCEGTNFTLAVGASNVTSYQWLLNGSPISGASSSSYTGTNASGANAGDYVVEMTNSCGTISSSIATIDIELLPTISNTLSNQSICVGDPLSFAISAAGSNLEYQWLKDGSAIPGEESASLTLSSVGLVDGGSYSVNVFNGCGNVTSNVATVTVTEPIAITNAPSPAVVCAGDNHTFSVTASGTNPSYNWTLNGNTLSTGSTLTLSNVQTANTGNYVVAVSNSCGTETAAPVSLTVNEAAVIATHPVSNQTICSGDALNLSVVSVSSGLSYQWKKDGVDIPGATSMNFVIGSTETTDSGIYTVEITNNCGTVTSNNAEVLVIQQTIIQSQPAPSSVCINDNYTFNVSAIGNGLSYQWQKDGVNLSGETGTSLVITNAQITDNGNYTVIVTGTCGVVTSSVADFTVTGGASIINQPQDIAICINQSGTLEVNATGPGLSYEWSFEGNPILGANSSTYTIPAASAANEGAYTVTVTGLCGNPVVSSVATVTLNTQPVYTSIPDPATYCEGDQVTLTATFSNDVTSVQWFKNGDFVTSNALGTLELNPIALSDAGNYVINAINGCGSLASPAFAIAVNPTFVTNLQETVCFGETVEIGGNTYDQTGNFSVLLQTIEGCDSTVNLDLTVLPEVTNTIGASICLGDSYTFDGQSLSVSGTYTATFTTVNSGCDSTVTLNLSVIDSSVPFSETVSVCFGETYTFGTQTLSQSGNYSETFQSIAGCDSTVVLAFTVEDEIVPIVSVNEATATVEPITGASYQWVDCNNGNTPISGAISNTFTANTNGNYAVTISVNNCEVVSNCVELTMSNVGIDDEVKAPIRVYPNPSKDYCVIDNIPSNSTIKIVNVLGQEVDFVIPSTSTVQLDVSRFEEGVYFLQFELNSAIIHLTKLVVNK